MKRRLPFAPFTFACIALVTCGPALAQDQELARLWDDPTFKRQFIGTYGINAEIEPRVTPDDVKLLEKLRPLMADDLPKAESMLAKQVKDDSSALLDFTLGGIHFQQQELDEALVCYSNAVAKFPSFRRAWRNLGLIHARTGKYDEAITAFTRMIELGGGDGYAFGLLGFAYASKQDHQAAEAAYRNALLLQPANTEWRLGLTRCVFKQGKFEDAAALLDVLIARFPDKAEFWLLQAHTYLGMKQPLKAALNLESLDLLGRSTIDSLHTLGDIYVGEQLLDLAAHAYERGVSLDVQQPIARPLRAAEVLAARGAVRQARSLAAHLRRTHEAMLVPAERATLLKLEARIALSEDGGEASTIQLLEDVVREDPLDGEALMLLGRHFARGGEPDRAIFFYERAQGIAAFEVDAAVRHAQVLVGMSRYTDALPLLRRAQDLRPREDVARYLEQIERIAKARR